LLFFTAAKEINMFNLWSKTGHTSEVNAKSNAAALTCEGTYTEATNSSRSLKVLVGKDLFHIHFPTRCTCNGYFSSSSRASEALKLDSIKPA